MGKLNMALIIAVSPPTCTTNARFCAGNKMKLINYILRSFKIILIVLFVNSSGQRGY